MYCRRLIGIVAYVFDSTYLDRIVTPQTWCTILAPQTQCRTIPQTQCRTIIKNVPKSKQKKSSINNNNLQSILTLCKTVEAHYNSPQDIEWACINNEIYLLQSRPITTLGVEKDHPHQQICR